MRHFSKCEIYVWSVSIIFGRKICARISHFKANWYDFLRCETLVPNFHKCEELVPNSLMSDVSGLNSHICEKWYQIVTCEKNLYKSLTCEELVPNLQTCEMLVPNYQRYEELVLNCHRLLRGGGSTFNDFMRIQREIITTKNSKPR